MAELPRYRKEGLLSVVSPSYPGAALTQASRSAEAFTAAMDRVARAAFGVAEQQAKVKGVEYGATRAPTKEQLEEAKKSGADPESLLPGDTFSVFGTAARTAALETLSVNMEKEARDSISNLQTLFEAEQIDLSQLQLGLIEIQNTYGSTLQDVSPTAASKLRATLATTGNSAFLSATKTQMQRIKDDQESVFRAAIDQDIREVDNVVINRGTINNGEFVSIDDYVQSLRDRITAKGVQLDDPALTQTKLNELEQRVNTAKVNAIVSDVIQDPGKGLLALEGQKGHLTTQAQTVLDGMSQALRLETRKQIVSAISTQNALESAEDARNDRERREKADDAIVMLVSAKRKGDVQKMTDALDLLSLYDADKYSSYADAMMTDGGIDDDAEVERLTKMFINNTITEEAVNSVRTAGKITSDTYLSLLEKVRLSRNTNYQNAMKEVKRQIGLPDKPLYNADAIDRQAMQEVAAIESELFFKLREEPDIDPMSIVTPLIQKANDERRTAATRKAARAAYYQIKAKYKSDDPEVLLQKALNDPQFGADSPVTKALQDYIRLSEE